MQSLLNLGCGTRFHHDWTNLDFKPVSPFVQRCDLRQGIPFPDRHFDAVYHSHLLEHFPKSVAPRFLAECHRVLKPSGIIRIAVPDLEKMATVYLQILGFAEQGDRQWEQKYDWMLLEMYDQLVREQSGGEMAKYLSQEIVPEKEFIESRLGGEARRHFDKSKALPKVIGHQQERLSWFRQIVRFIRFSSFRRERLLIWLLKDEYELLSIGRFRRSGEVHQWMYDRFSLSRLLLEIGFIRPKVVGPTESQILNWPNYYLDTEPDRSISKPDSLFMEATKQ